MILRCEDGQVPVPDTLDGTVVDVVLVRDETGPFEAVLVHGVSVVLGCDVHPVAVFHGLVASPVAEFELVCGAAHGECDELASEAYAEEGHLTGEVLDGADGGSDDVRLGGVARTVGDEDPLDAGLDDDVGGHRSRSYRR